MTPRQLLNEIKSPVHSDYPSAEIILFGSRARKDDEASSDWDLLILIDEDLTEKQKIDIHDKLYEIELETGQIISAIIHIRKEWRDPSMKITPFYQNVVREGVVI